MRTISSADRARYWRVDPEHEAFRGLAWRSVLRLALVLAAIVAVLWLIVMSTAYAQPPARTVPPATHAPSNGEDQGAAPDHDRPPSETGETPIEG